MRTDMRGKDFVTLMDYTGEEIQTILLCEKNIYLAGLTNVPQPCSPVMRPSSYTARPRT